MSSALPVAGPPAEPVPLHWEPLPAEVVAGEAGTLRVTLSVPPGFEVYGHTVAVSVGGEGVDGAGFTLGAPEFTAPPPDELGRVRLSGTVPLSLPLHARDAALGLHELPLHVAAQGCQAGRCLPLGEAEVAALVHVRSPEPRQLPRP